jgi:hypothetical protein
MVVIGPELARPSAATTELRHRTGFVGTLSSWHD